MTSSRTVAIIVLLVVIGRGNTLARAGQDVAGGALSGIVEGVRDKVVDKVSMRAMRWAAEFVARQHVIDGVLQDSVRVDPSCTADCDHEAYQGDLKTIKELTGIDMGLNNPGTEEYMIWRTDQIDRGRLPNRRVIRSYPDILAARDAGEYAVMYYLQSRKAPDFQLEGDISKLRRWYDEGLRVLQLAWHISEGHGPNERLGYSASEGEEGGVTQLGHMAIVEMNKLGMIVDVSHCNRQTTLDAAVLSTTPILATHANAIALTPHHRNKTDEELLAIAATGGVIGATTIRWMLDTDDDGVAGMDDMITHIEYMVELVGVDHVGIATDSWLDGWERSSSHYADADLAAPDRWVRLTARLRSRGWSEDNLAKLLGDNLRRVFAEILGN